MTHTQAAAFTALGNGILTMFVVMLCIVCAAAMLIKVWQSAAIRLDQQDGIVEKASFPVVATLVVVYATYQVALYILQLT